MHEHQNPMTGFKLLEQAFSQGFRMRPVPGTEDLFVEIDQGLRTERYTYARLTFVDSVRDDSGVW